MIRSRQTIKPDHLIDGGPSSVFPSPVHRLLIARLLILSPPPLIPSVDQTPTSPHTISAISGRRALYGLHSIREATRGRVVIAGERLAEAGRAAGSPGWRGSGRGSQCHHRCPARPLGQLDERPRRTLPRPRRRTRSGPQKTPPRNAWKTIQPAAAR